MDPKQHEKVAVGVSTVTIVINLTLAGFKFLAGFLAHSGAMISDAVHSASDVLATLIVILGVKLAGRDADRSHPYGHERLECVAALILAVILGATGLGIGWSGIRKITGSGELAVPGLLALIAAVVSIVVKEAMFWYTWLAAKRINSSVLKAEAWHHRSDALSSVGSFAGILGARLGFPALDPVASVVICLFIVKAAVDIFRDAVDKMVDRSCDEDTVKALKKCAAQQEGVLSVDFLNTRVFGNKIYVDIEIGADGALSLNEAHTIAERTHDAIETKFPKVKHIMVHVNPYHENHK